MALLPQVSRAIRSLLLRPLYFTSILVTAGLVLLITALAGFITPAQAASFTPHRAAALLQGATGGKQIFDQSCSGCHTIGRGVLIGPDLKDVTKQRDLQWIKDFITDPAKMIASDPAAQQLRKGFSITMPTLGLTTDQIDQVVAYLSNPGAAGPTTPGAAFPAGVGTLQAGKQDFLGETPLTYGGPACIACHTVGGAALLGGGSLGPDLTHVIQRLGEPGVAAALQTIAFPTMAGPFLNKPLTIQEQADLVAFLKDADLNQPPVPVFAPGALTTNTLLVASIGLGGMVLLFAVLLYYWLRLKKLRTPGLPARKITPMPDQAER